jgi:hypothetical protein
MPDNKQPRMKSGISHTIVEPLVSLMTVVTQDGAHQVQLAVPERAPPNGHMRTNLIGCCRAALNQFETGGTITPGNSAKIL